MTSPAIKLYARATPGFEQRLALTTKLLQQAAAQHPGRIVQATSLGAEDMVITDLIARHQIPITIATLDTGMLHAQTLALITRVQTHYGLAVERFAPVPSDVTHFVHQHGDNAMRQSISLRKACCALRKLEPLGRMLKDQTAWVTGLRQDQSDTRASVPLQDTDAQGRSKFNPLAAWSWFDVWHYVALHGVPTNALHDEFFPSIGCEPCTRAVAVGEPFRAGRWWWELEAAKECGLHVKA